MQLYLVQHGQAMSKEVDPNRPLNEEGRVARNSKVGGAGVETGRRGRGNPPLGQTAGGPNSRGARPGSSNSLQTDGRTRSE
jgi:hypothetical protein